MSNRRWVLVDQGSVTAPGRVTIVGEEARHLAVVLRRRPGDPVVLADGCGAVATGTVAGFGRGTVDVDVDSVEVLPRPAGGGLTLALGVLHGPAMDWAIQKAVELGVAHLVPAVMARSQLGEVAAGSRLDHWRKVARQGLKQCCRPWAMEVESPRSLTEVVERTPPDRAVFADREGVPIRELERDRNVTLLLVGPEGGLTEAERRLVAEAGWPAVALGAFVLRSETAAVVGAAMLTSWNAPP